MHRVIHIFFTALILSVLFMSRCYLFAGQGITENSHRSGPEAAPELLTSGVLADSIQNAPKQTVADSVKYSMEEVIVESSRIRTSSQRFSLPTEQFLRNDLTNANSASLAGILTYANDIFVKDYGGTSALKTLSQRGMGTEHTLVLVNGLRVTSSQNGLIDLGIVPLTGVHHLEVVSGGGSSAFGSDAVAGVVNILTMPRDRKPAIEAATAVGSFGYVNGSLSASAGTGPVFFRTFYEMEKSDDNYDFQFEDRNGVHTLQRQNSDVTAWNAGVDASANLNADQELTLSFGAYDSERGVGGPVVSATPTSSARQQDDRQLLQVGWKVRLSPATRAAVQAQGHRAYQRYRDPELNIGGRIVDSYFTNLDMRVAPTLSTSFSDDLLFAAGGEIARVQAIGNTMATDEVRISTGVFATADANLIRNAGPIGLTVLSAGLRYDGESGGADAWSPQGGLVVSFQEFAAPEHRARLSLTANFSRNFRIPTFNELFYNGGGGIGDPDLLPERSTNMDAGIRGSFHLFGHHEIQLSYFNIAMNNRIVWIAAGAGNVTPKNLRATRSDGIEISYRLAMLEESLLLNGNFSQVHSIKTEPDYPGDPTVGNQLIYVPEQKAHLSLTVRHEWEGWMREAAIEGRYSFVGYRYYTEDNSSFLPSYSSVDLIARTRLGTLGGTIDIKFEVNNALNKDYQVISGYPMPLRSLRTTIVLIY